jgi:hypothetical protein
MKTSISTARAIGGHSAAPALGPQWIGIPSRGHCPVTSLSRPHVYQLIAAGVIRSACIRKPGAVRGRRLIYLPSLLAYLDKCADAEAMRLAKKAGDL